MAHSLNPFSRGVKDAINMKKIKSIVASLNPFSGGE